MRAHFETIVPLFLVERAKDGSRYLYYTHPQDLPVSVDECDGTPVRLRVGSEEFAKRIVPVGTSFVVDEIIWDPGFEHSMEQINATIQNTDLAGVTVGVSSLFRDPSTGTHSEGKLVSDPQYLKETGAKESTE